MGRREFFRTSRRQRQAFGHVILSTVGGSKVILRNRVLLAVTLIGAHPVVGSALAQTRGGVVTIQYAAFSPFLALLAGILILIVPRLLNYIVALYLILVGLIGIFGR
jgi:hypothetical protein